MFSYFIVIRGVRLRLRFVRNVNLLLMLSPPAVFTKFRRKLIIITSDKYEIREHKELRSKFTKNAGGGGHLLQESNNIREGVTQ